MCIFVSFIVIVRRNMDHEDLLALLKRAPRDISGICSRRAPSRPAGWGGMGTEIDM